MKLSHLSLAILSAIALSACGGGSDSGTPVKDPDPKPEVTPDQDKDKNEQPADKEIDPAQTGVVGDLDLNKEASVGTLQYIRNADSQYDRQANPKESTSATSILGVTLNEQNPDLTNIALAKLVDPKTKKIKVVQYLGNNKERALDIDYYLSLQQQNKHNVQIPINDRDSYKYDRMTFNGKTMTDLPSTAYQSKYKVVDEAFIKGRLAIVDKAVKAFDAKKKDWNQDQKERYAELKAVQKQLKELSVLAKKDKDLFTRQLMFLPDEIYYWGDYVPTQEAVRIGAPSADNATKNPVAGIYNQEAEFVSGTASSASVVTGPFAVGLVGIQYEGYKKGTDKEKIFVQGTEEKSRSSSRIFGRNFNVNGLNVVANSYEDADTVLTENGVQEIADFSGSDSDALLSNAFNSFKAAKTASDNNLIKYSLAVKPMKLENVQYGRVTGNLDLPDLTDEEKESRLAVYKRAVFLNKENPEAVDTYFYRGPHATTLEQMGQLPSGKELTYRGHALMYGIDNGFHGKVTTTVPNAFGAKGRYALGNFVQATLVVDKNRVEKGAVYNVWHDGVSKDVVKDTLVRFDGNLHGNTVIGEAQRVYDTSDKADFRASFFGDKADEMGGSINSTTWQERYGAQGDIWGGVFGAKRVTEVSAGDKLYNQQLGDIPDLTKPVNQAGVEGTSNKTETPKAE